MTKTKEFSPYYKTSLGEMVQGDSVEILKARKAKTVDLIITSPPFGLIRKKAYGNVHADVYCDWFKPFAQQFLRLLKDTDSLVIDIGGAWKNGQPTQGVKIYVGLDSFQCLVFQRRGSWIVLFIIPSRRHSLERSLPYG
jgi:DNA modification methylase